MFESLKIGAVGDLGALTQEGDDCGVRSGEHRIRETAGYGACTSCGCGGYYNDGTGDCRCGHSFGQHYS